jgi:CMP-N,N'-diacetyllegionaminic acid synthase
MFHQNGSAAQICGGHFLSKLTNNRNNHNNHMQEIIAIIPARGGSKGIPGKNIRMVNGKPLIAWSIEHARQSPQIARVFVSTDSPEIGAVARDYCAEVIERPSEISGDKASSEAALSHLLEHLHKEEQYEPELVVFLQATSPMRDQDEIERAIATLEREGSDSLFAACRVDGFTWRLGGGAIAPVNYDPTRRPLRQDLKEEIWEENGSFYIFKPWVLRKFSSRLGGKISIHRMPALYSFQIDEFSDLELVEHLMRFKIQATDQEESSGVTIRA